MPTIQVKDANGDTVYLDVASGSGTALDPYVSTTVVTATNLDIRDLSSSTDSVAVTDGGGSITVDGTVSVTGVATSTNQSTTNTYLGATNETAPADDTASSGLNGRLQRIAQRLTVLISRVGESQASPTQYTIADRLKALLTGIILAAGENHIGEIGGRTRVVNGSFTRPNDTTAYAAGDAVTDNTSTPSVITFSGCSRVNNGSGVIVGVTLIDSANQSTAGQFELWVFDTTFTPDNDNAVFSPTDAECATLVGIVPLNLSYVGDATSGAGGNRVYIASNLNIPFQTGASTTNLFGALVVRNAYTPVAQETFTARLRILQD